MHQVEIDFMHEGPDEGAQTELNAWLTEFAPTVNGRVLRAHGPAGGAAEVELTADVRFDLERALLVLCGGDAQQVADDFEIVTV